MTPLKDEDENSPLEYKLKRARSPSVSSTKSRKRGSVLHDTGATKIVHDFVSLQDKKGVRYSVCLI